MSQTVLGSLALAYRLFWSRERLAVAVQLHVDPDPNTPVDAQHLLAVLDDLWPSYAPRLQLAVASTRLLRDLLEHSTADGPWLEVSEAALLEPAVLDAARDAQARGLHLVWQGEPGHRPAPDLASLFERLLISLNPEEANQLLHLPQQAVPTALADAVRGQFVPSMAQPALAERCLDEFDVTAVLGWPVPAARAASGQAIEGPSRSGIERVLKAIDNDASLDEIEHSLSDNPVLIYRFLQHLANTAAARRAGIESIHHGLMLLGDAGLRRWLHDQLGSASNSIVLRPLRATLVTRAHLVEHLLDVGSEDELRREIYLCGLLSQIDLLLGEPLPTALSRIPLPARIEEALLAGRGPYRPYLDIAAALESPRAGVVQALCTANQLDVADVNRALLRTLAGLGLDPVRRRRQH